MSNSIKSLLQITDKAITFNASPVSQMEIKGKLSHIIQGKLSYTVAHCPHCGMDKSIVKNGVRRSKITLPSISGLPAYLWLDKQRYFCQHCHKSMTASTPIVSPNAFISTRLKQMIIAQLSNPISESYIAKHHHVSVNTVRRIADNAARELQLHPGSMLLPQHLSMDEFKSVKSANMAMSFIFSDASSHKVLDICQNRQLSYLATYYSQFTLASRQNVETVTMDMYSPYMTLVQSLFPKAKIIIDRFHIVQALNRELNKYRIKLMNAIKSKNARLYRKLKTYWKLLLADRDNLSSSDYDHHRLFRCHMTTAAIVDYLLDQDEQLKATYYLIHRLRERLKQGDFQAFKGLIEQSAILNIPSNVRKGIRSLKKYLPYIENTCQYRQYSNGSLEGTNNKIKVLKRNVDGYRNFHHFKNRILLICKIYRPQCPSQSNAA